MSGSLMSIVNTAVPFVLATLSIFTAPSLPISFQAAGLFRLGLGRQLHLHRHRGELTEAALPAGGMADHAVVDPDLAGRHRPRFRSGGDQHAAPRRRPPRASACSSWRWPSRAAGALRAEGEMSCVQVRSGWRMVGAHLRPVGVEFVGDEGGVPVIRPLPELDVFAETVTVLSGLMIRNVFGAMLTCGAGLFLRERQRHARGDIDADGKAGAGLQQRTAGQRAIMDGHGISPPASSRPDGSRRGCGRNTSLRFE